MFGVGMKQKKMTMEHCTSYLISNYRKPTIGLLKTLPIKRLWWLKQEIS